MLLACNISGIVGDLFVLDISDLDRLTWMELTTTTLGTTPPARAFHSMTCADGQLYVFGGWAGFTGVGALALPMSFHS